MSGDDRPGLLVRVPNWLGDLVLAWPVLESAAHGAAQSAAPSIFAGPEAFRSFLEPRFPNTRYVAVSRARRWDAVGAIRAARPRKALLLTDSFSSALLAWLARVPERIGHDAEGRGFLLTKRVPRSGAARTASRVSEYQALAAAAGLSPASPAPRLAALPAEIARAERILERAGFAARGYLVVAPGASFGPAKQWEADRFVGAVARMEGRGDRGLVVVGAGDDRPVSAAVTEGARSARIPCANLAGQTELPDLIGILAGATAVLSNDSGVMHVAAALARPTVAVFGSTSPVWTSVSAPWVTNLYAAYPCSPCYRRTCPIGYGCLRSIAPAQAAAALDRSLVGASPAGFKS